MRRDPSRVQQVLEHSFNSSHFVWLISDLKNFKSSEGVLFAYQVSLGIVVIALEPIANGPLSAELLRQGLKELLLATGASTWMFVGVQTNSLKLFKAARIDTDLLCIGKEPWVNLSVPYLPRGNTGKGIRSAKNQAIRNGVTTKKWEELDLVQHREDIRNLREIWSEQSQIELKGFMLATDPFYRIDGRYYRGAYFKDQLVGLLIASPIDSKKQYYIEDLYVHPDSPSGVGEVLILAALDDFYEMKVKRASLGVVAGLPKHSVQFYPSSVGFRLLLRVSGSFFKEIYNSEGIDLFRKRFAPQWEEQWIVLPAKASMGLWIKSLVALALAHKPSIRFTLKPAYWWLHKKVQQIPVTMFFQVLLAFGSIINILNPHFYKEHQLGISPADPNWRWIYQIVLSDFFQESHYSYVAITLMIAFLFPKVERRLKTNKMLIFMVLIMIFDDLIIGGWLALMKILGSPMGVIIQKYNSTVGASYIVASFAGMFISMIKRGRDLILASIMIFSVFIFSFGNFKGLFTPITGFYILFGALGFVAGRAHARVEKKQSLKTCKGNVQVEMG